MTSSGRKGLFELNDKILIIENMYDYIVSTALTVNVDGLAS